MLAKQVDIVNYCTSSLRGHPIRLLRVAQATDLFINHGVQGVHSLFLLHPRPLRLLNGFLAHRCLPQQFFADAYDALRAFVATQNGSNGGGNMRW